MFRADKLVKIPDHRPFMTETAIGDVLAIRSGGPPMVVIGVGEKILCRYAAAASKLIALPLACLVPFAAHENVLDHETGFYDGDGGAPS